MTQVRIFGARVRILFEVSDQRPPREDMSVSTVTCDQPDEITARPVQKTPILMLWYSAGG